MQAIVFSKVTRRLHSGGFDSEKSREQRVQHPPQNRKGIVLGGDAVVVFNHLLALLAGFQDASDLGHGFGR